MTAQPIKKLPNYRTFRRIVRISVAVLIFLSVIFSVLKSTKEYNLTLRAAELQTKGYAAALKEHAERTISEADNALTDIAEHIVEHGGFSSYKHEQLISIMNLHKRNAPQIASIILVDSNGLIFAHSLDADPKQSNLSESDYFIHHKKNPTESTPYISAPHKSSINGVWSTTLSRPILDKDHNFIGIIALDLNLDYFHAFYSSLNIGTTGKIIMVRKDGVLLLAQPFKDSDYGTDFKKSHLITKYLPQSASGTFYIESGKALLESNSRIISYESLGRFPIVAIANMGVEEVTAEWYQRSVIQGFLTAIFSVSLWIFSVLLLRQVRKIEDGHALQLEQQLEIATSAKAWQTTFDAVSDAIWVMDLDRHILRSNRATSAIFGKDKDKIIGHLCCEIAHNGESPLPSCPFQRMLETKNRASMQITIGNRWYDISVDPIKDEAGEITGAVHIVSDITDIKRAEEVAIESESRMRGLLSAIPDAIFFKDADGRWLLVNHSAIKLFALDTISYQGRNDLELAEMLPDFKEALFKCSCTDKDAWEHGGLTSFEEIIPTPNGMRTFEVIKIPLFKEDGVRRGLVVIARDVTEQQIMEGQLRQAQKMEAIGHLAGGIAHDFNNLLTPIIGYSEMIAARLNPSDPINSKLAGISAAAHKAKDLTQQLLSFGRRKQIGETTVDLNEIVEGFNIILHRTIRESISIKLHLDPNGAFITGDRSQIEQIILNMTVNAQDAMDGKGEIFIETCHIYMEGENARLHPGMAEGDYILLSFRDNGSGMSQEVMAHIFEPFYTTKAIGHGTGLGLATVYGIVKQHKGYISVTSREGSGTTFNIYFPANNIVPIEKPAEKACMEKPDSDKISVLVVEDNEMVRDMVKEMLEGYGYSVLAATEGGEAIEIARTYRDKINLMVSDVVMPGLSGPEVYEQLLTFIPHLKVIYISGYPMNPSLRGDTLEEEVSCYLQKPFTAEALIERIRQVIG